MSIAAANTADTELKRSVGVGYKPPVVVVAYMEAVASCPPTRCRQLDGNKLPYTFKKASRTYRKFVGYPHVPTTGHLVHIISFGLIEFAEVHE